VPCCYLNCHPLTWLNTRPDVDKPLGVESGRQTERREYLGILEHRIPADSLGGDCEDLERVQLVSATEAPIGGGHRLGAVVESGCPEQTDMAARHRASNFH
jgi:hypothetical protein